MDDFFEVAEVAEVAEALEAVEATEPCDVLSQCSQARRGRPTHPHATQRAERVEVADIEVIDPMAPMDSAKDFFAPVPSDIFSSLIAEYQGLRSRIQALAAHMADSQNSGVLHYFTEGNYDDRNGRWHQSISSLQLERLFDEAGALKVLDSTFWSRALAYTDVRELMPHARRKQWDEDILTHNCPTFDEDTVRSTLTQLLAMREQFFSERVDGIFRALSGDHVTNVPQGFTRRMIISGVIDDLGMTGSSSCGVIDDLRVVVAKFMGRDEPKLGITARALPYLKANWGQWCSLDGGVLRARLYRKGTMHLEVHRDMAWRLNRVLASLYPMAIPSQFRQPSKRQPKDIELVLRPLPFRVLDILNSAERGWTIDSSERKGCWDTVRRYIPNSVNLPFSCDLSSVSGKEAVRVLQMMGGVGDGNDDRMRLWRFDYDPLPAIQQIVASGCLPDRVAHQFYPTPESLARICADLALLGTNESTRWLEPSAGQGGLAQFLPKAQLTCVEVSALHCEILRAKGYVVEQADFLQWARAVPARARSFERIVANPPFSDGRALAHLQCAAELVAPGGRLVAILPAGMRNKFQARESGALGALNLPGFDITLSQLYESEFAQTSVAVVILVADRKPADACCA